MVGVSTDGGNVGATGAAGAKTGGFLMTGISKETRGSGLDSEVSHGWSKISGNVAAGVTVEGVWGGRGTLL